MYFPLTLNDTHQLVKLLIYLFPVPYGYFPTVFQSLFFTATASGSVLGFDLVVFFQLIPAALNKS
ncbi:MAG: hypothetical protein AN485_18380 [Anabaena sp. MDT14b]|nr:MAG: hypothetical protein AN485_18380 [Anabaena sp. MDT14b]